MKIAVISDIHGNFPALQAVLADIDRNKVQQVYCLGDLVGYHSMINEVIDEIRKRNIPCLSGNHDYALVHREGVIERSKTCTAILKRQLTEISPENREFLSSLRDSFMFSEGGRSFFCVHGGLDDFTDEYIREIDEAYFKRHDFRHDVLLTGHTHIPRYENAGKKIYLNPGSVGQPRDGNPQASYLLISGTGYTHRRVVYNIDEITGDMKKKNYAEYIYVNLYRGLKVGAV